MTQDSISYYVVVNKAICEFEIVSPRNWEGVDRGPRGNLKSLDLFNIFI
jgi:hypothetical protein